MAGIKDNTYKPSKSKRVSYERVKSLDDLEPGSHIFFKRKLGYDHHAIVIACDPSSGAVRMVEFFGKGLTTAMTIQESSLHLDPAKDRVFKYNYSESLPPEQVIKNAKSRIGDGQYNVLTNNCEHFATWCKTGVAESKQVKSAGENLLEIAADVVSEEVGLPKKIGGVCKSTGDEIKCVDVGEQKREMLEKEIEMQVRQIDKYGHVGSLPGRLVKEVGKAVIGKLVGRMISGMLVPDTDN